MKVVYAERARQDIADIYTSIARHDVQAAQRVEDRIRQVCEGLAEFPYASAATDEPGVRRVPLVRYPYTVFYRVDDARQRVEIARVLHGARVTDLGHVPE
ncbi:MAG: type II toxin-antitoxin system RelE/ParE family toxin [Hyphomicrobiaceae bacterium]